MSYLVLARKYRPAGFSSVSGQEHVTRTLSNAIKRDKVVHAYLFTGPRGVGKTSVARILSKAINCQKSGATEPCLECQSCKEIAAGTSLAVREIDGASHNSVDNVRDLMDSFKSLPPPGYRFKVYIIDEVHMLSVSAFNALLKSLEEPPPNTVFILATTEVHKIPETVLSRCQRHDFRALSVQTIEQRLKQVCSDEKIDADGESLALIARLADGSMRDAQTLLDRVQSFCEGKITADETSRALGTVERRALAGLASSILARDVERVLSQVADLFASGIDPSTMLREFVSFWREVFVAKLGGEQRLKLMGIGDDSTVELLRMTGPLEAVDVQDLWDVAREGADRCIRSAHPRYGFEALVVRMATRQPVAELAEVISKLSAQADGGAASARPTPVAHQASPAAQARSASPRLEARPAAAPPSTPTPAQPPTPAAPAKLALSWEEFLRGAADKSGKVYIESLKRLRVARFEHGVIEGTGPEFNVKSVMGDKAKLMALLNDFVNQQGMNSVTTWKIAFVKGQGAAESSASRGGATSPARGNNVEAVQGHPALQSLQKIFPGSKVEQVRSKN